MAILDDVKAALRVTGTADDALLERLIRSATRECLAFLNATVLPTDTTASVTEDVFQGIVLMVQADFDGDPAMRDTYRAAAQRLWWPYRTTLGIG